MREIKGSKTVTLGSVAVGRRSAIKGLSAATAVAVLPIGGPFAAEPFKGTISEAIHLGFYIPIYVAKDKGLFAKHGIDMAIKSAGGIAQPVPALLSGDAQFAVTGTGMSVNSTVEGGRMVNVAKIVGHISVWVVGKPGTEVNSIADLKGKTIATLKYPSNTITTPTYAMKSVGGYSPEEAGVKFLQLPFGAQIPAVVDGRADVATVFEWDASIAEKQFGLKTLFSLGKIFSGQPFSPAHLSRTISANRSRSLCRHIATLSPRPTKCCTRIRRSSSKSRRPNFPRSIRKSSRWRADDSSARRRWCRAIPLFPHRNGRRS